MDERAPHRVRTTVLPSAVAVASLTALLLVTLPSRAGLVAQEPGPQAGPVEPHPEAQDAIGRLKSPFCPGLMLEVCPSPQAGLLRDTLQSLAREGAEADSLVEWVLSRWGEEWRAVPRAEGRGLWAWLMPPLALLFGAGLVVLALRRLGGEGDAGSGESEAPALTEEDERRIAEALRELERQGG